MKHVVLAPIGDHIEPLYVGIREFPTERVILIVPSSQLEIAEKAKKTLDTFKIPAQIKVIQGNIWEELFRVVGEISQLEKDSNLILNVSTGDSMMKCAATCAAFVNGIKAFDVMGNEVMMLPILKFSYYKLLTDTKMNLLKVIHETKGCCSSLEELSKKNGMSLPLISYHINGNLKSQGLKEYGLVDTVQKNGRISVSLSMLGKMLIKGYVR